MSADQKNIADSQKVEETPEKESGEALLSASSEIKEEEAVAEESKADEVTLEKGGEGDNASSSYRSFFGHNFVINSLEKYDLSELYAFYEFDRASLDVFEATATTATTALRQTQTAMLRSDEEDDASDGGSEDTGSSLKPTEPTTPITPTEPTLPVTPVEPTLPQDPGGKDDNSSIFPSYTGAIHYLSDGDDVYFGDFGTLIHGGKGDDELSTPWPEEGLSDAQIIGTGFTYNQGDGHDILKGWGNIYFGEGIGLSDLSFDGMTFIVADGSLDVSALKLNHVYFADGQAMDAVEVYKYFGLIKDLTEVTTGDDDDIIGLIEGWNLVKSGAGDDIIDIIGGHNKVFAGNGDDVIEIHGFGNEVTGGKGDDVIRIGTVASQHADSQLDDVEMPQGDDHLANLSIIHYNQGDGDDILEGYFNVQLGEGIAKEDISFEKQGSQSFIHFNGGGSLEISGMYGYDSIKFFDGSELDLSGSGLTWVGMIM